MGSIVKTIGKVIKKVGKALKKIAPILLVAAAAYVGYGYMTGFQAGGWPQITEWGKSLFGGINSGQSLSQAANAAGTAVQSGAAVDTAQAATSALPTVATTAQPITEAVTSATRGMPPPTTPLETAGTSTFGQGESGLLSQIGENTNTRYTSLMDNLGTQLQTNNLGSSIDNFFMSDAQASGISGRSLLPSVSTGGASGEWTGDIGHAGDWSGSTTSASTLPTSTLPTGPTYTPDTLTGTGPGLSTLQGPKYYSSSQDIGTGNIEIPHTQTGNSFYQKMQVAFGNTFGKAWEVYKGLWKSNPFLAMYGTSKIIQLVMAALDNSAEKESYRSRHVMGFPPDNFEALAKKSGGPLPGAGSKKTGIWAVAQAGDSARQPKVRTGPQISGRPSISAINRRPPGLVGPTQGVIV